MNSSMWFFPASALINAVTSTVLGFYLIFIGFNRRVARYLLFFCVSVAAWSYCYFFWQISIDAESALFWSRALMFGAIFSSISYLHLVIVFLKLDNLKFYKITLIGFYLFSLFWVTANFTPYFVAGVAPRSYFKFWPLPGPFYIPYLAAFFSHVVYASVLLFKNYRQSHGSLRVSAFLLLVGIVVAFAGGSTNYPLWYGVNVAPWGNVLVSVYVVLTVYAMLRYKLMDIKVISAELFTGLLAIILLTDLFLSKNPTEIFFRALVVVSAGVFGVMLIRSVRREVARREEVTQLAHSLEQANLRLQEIDRQKTEFLSIASHQLRTPLSVLKGYIELIKDGAFGKPTEKMVHALDEMDESNEHLVKLIDEFLDITRIEQGRTKYDFTKCDLKNLITCVVKELRERAESKKMKLAWCPPAEAVVINCDEEKIHHVVLNFVDNAIKYSDSGRVTVCLCKKKSGVEVKVKDHGIGFDKVDEANFFQKFYRGKNVRDTNVNGTGLGLYVCNKFVEAHQGKVWAKSVGLGKGSEFGFWIPIGDGEKKL